MQINIPGQLPSPKGRGLCFNFGRLSDAKAGCIAVEINETRFESDNIKLAESAGLNFKNPLKLS